MFEYTTKMDEFVSDEDYDSSDEEADHDGGIARRHIDHNMTRAPPAEADVNEGNGYLNPLAKAKLVHLLRRLPESNTKLRRGDVARLTGFAIEHAGAGADEVAQLITRNVIDPFRFHGSKDSDTSDQEDPGNTPQDKETARAEGPQDKSPSSLVGLYIISDILSTSASAGVRHAWRYRSLFETQLRQQRVFAKLGRLDRDLDWGKLKADKWRRSVQSVLSLWEGWSVFPHTSHEEFVDQFFNPPLTEKEKRAAEAEQEQKEAELRRIKSNSKWRSVEDEQRATPLPDASLGDGDGVAMADEDDDVDGEAMDIEPDDDLDGVPMVDSSDEEAEHAGTAQQREPGEASPSEPAKGLAPWQMTVSESGKRQRPRAVDMFADDSEG
jgi:U2-associated protein SR140